MCGQNRRTEEARFSLSASAVNATTALILPNRLQHCLASLLDNGSLLAI